MSKVGTIIVKEMREALPAALFFLVLFHLLALTKAVSLEEYTLTALRAVTATVAALLVAKAILVVEALPISRLFSHRLIFQVLWKTLLYSAMVLLFRVMEEAIPLMIKKGSVMPALSAMFDDLNWPFFAVTALWIIAGLFFYCLVSELVRELTPEKVKEVLFGKRRADRQ